LRGEVYQPFLDADRVDVGEASGDALQIGATDDEREAMVLEEARAGKSATGDGVPVNSKSSDESRGRTPRERASTLLEVRVYVRLRRHSS
jgi:hypothetical protein